MEAGVLVSADFFVPDLHDVKRPARRQRLRQRLRLRLRLRIRIRLRLRGVFFLILLLHYTICYIQYLEFQILNLKP